MATIKKISGISDAGSLTTNHRLLVEDPSGNLRSTTVGAVNNHTHSYLPLAGGAMTGNISYKGTQSTSTMIKFLDNSSDTYGNGICIGGGGATIIGGGESADTVCSGLGVSGGDEKMIIAGDEGITFYTNCQSGFGSAKCITMDTNGALSAPAVYGSVWNDLSDSIPVDDDCELEHGYCYCFDGKKYFKSSKYMDKGIIGIHSDTYGFKMGNEEGKKKMDVAVSGFVLAYVDKEYEPGTPLTCTENGYLTEIKKEDKIEYPERIVATYWKNEPADEWGSEDRKVKVNGRKWVRVT